ncbi:catechol 2,3-dioxygenase-like lactoylglutathione lyase family enzyme [Chitinophaga polysaccharea]|uniref:Catechol 2,3-dioxygenase-like lactoylglutathione lyase family enzyme n=2 Tax=Chitinophaga polysaccharea TaxID=1293035 RepID=A0A561PWU8_9BACT|nr:catechol 2,3-dioxygenase-like lactoylglutathione lyase family enzyme [Chitinophaga polysaccharea]
MALTILLAHFYVNTTVYICHMTTITGIHHVAIQAKDYQATIKFYEALGLKRFHSWALPEFNIEYAALLNIRGTTSYVEIFDKDANVATQGRRPIGGEAPVSGALLHLAFTVSNAAQAYEDALTLGATSCIPPAVLHLGEPTLNIRNALVYGLDGEVIEFIEPHALTVMP